MTALALQIPVLETKRLILRGPEASDFAPIATFFADEARAWGFGGPLDAPNAWRWFAGSIGHWALHGYGFWTITDRATHTPLGLAGMWNPVGWPEAEIGWALFEEAEGKGIAYEAAMSARAYAYDVLGMPALSSNILPGNTRSVALAERMGARFEREYQNHRHGTELLYRHPGPDELADGGMEAYA